MTPIVTMMQRNKVRGVTPAPAGYDIIVSHQRWDAGTGTTLTSNSVELEQGALLPANLSGVSVWRDGVEIAVYAECLGVWPDGSARALFIQSSQTLTKDSNVAGGIKLTGGFNEARLSYTDDSADWTNAGETWSAMRDLGLPAGVIIPTDPAYLCAATSFGYLTPESTQTNFTIDTYSSTLFDDRLEASVSGIFPYGSASYHPHEMLWNKYCRTGDIRWAKDTFALMSYQQEAYWNTLGGLAEWYVEMSGMLMAYLLKNDTTVKDSNVWNSASASALQYTTYLDSYTSPRSWVRAMDAAFNMAKVGAQSYYASSPVGGGDVGPWLNSNWYTTPTTANASAVYQSGGRLINTNAYESDGATVQPYSFPYWNALYIDRLIRLYDLVTGSTPKTAILNAVTAMVDWHVTNMLSYLTASPYDTVGFLYSDADIWVVRNSAKVNGAYTSGATTIALKEISAFPSLPGENLYAGGTVSLGTGLETIQVASSVLPSGGNATVSLNSGFSTNLSDGTTVYTVQYQQASAGVPGTGSVDIELAGLWPHIFAWLWWKTGTTSYRDTAKDLICALGKPEGEGGPTYFLPKQVQEGCSLSQQTFALLQLGDAAWP